MKNKTIATLQKELGYKFKNQDLIIKSITHKSFNPKKNNEKLEFLGDRVLGLVISKKLLELYPNEKEGILDKKLASLVNRNLCFKIGEKINLSKFILIGSKNKNYKLANKKIISDCLLYTSDAADDL